MCPQVCMTRQCAVYIMSNIGNTVIYTGVTSQFSRRIQQHKDKLVEGFTKKYQCTKLVWYELFDWIDDAIVREKQIKNWRRQWKTELIGKENPPWKDLSNVL